MKAPAFQFYPSDFLASTAEMSAEEVGVHIRLLCNQWLRGSLPNDDERLKSMAGLCLPSSVAYAKERYSLCDDGMLRHQRLEDERLKQESYRKKQAEFGKKRWGNEATHEATLIQPSSVVSESPQATLCPPSPSPSPSPTIPPAEEERKAPAPTRFVPPTLAEWTTYAATLNPAWPADDAAGAWTHYQSNGWKVGRNTMRDWQSAAQNCHRRWKADRNRPLPFTSRVTPPNHGSATQAALDQYR